MGTTAYGGKGSKGRAANGDRPVGAASCRRDHHPMASCQTPPPRQLQMRTIHHRVMPNPPPRPVTAPYAGNCVNLAARLMTYGERNPSGALKKFRSVVRCDEATYLQCMNTGLSFSEEQTIELKGFKKGVKVLGIGAGAVHVAPWHTGVRMLVVGEQGGHGDGYWAFGGGAHWGYGWCALGVRVVRIRGMGEDGRGTTPPRLDTPATPHVAEGQGTAAGPT